MGVYLRRWLLGAICAGYEVFLRSFPKAFRDQVGEDISLAFKQGCGSALEGAGFIAAIAYAWRGYKDALKEGFAERRASPPAPYADRAKTRNHTVDNLFLDLRFSLRALRKRPVFSGIAIFVLALGIGSATAIFSVVNGVLLKPFPYPDVDRLVVLWNSNPERGQDEYRMAARGFFELQRSTSAFSGMAVAAGATANLTSPDLPPSRVNGSLISADFFQVLGVQPVMGRSFRPEENLGEHRVVLLSHSLWADRFGGDPEIIGKRIEMDGIQVEVVGVMPRVSLPMGGSSLSLPGPDVHLFWRPLDYDQAWISQFAAHVMAVVARLEPEAGIFQARQQAASVALSLVSGDQAPEGEEILVRPLKEQIVGDIRRNLLVLFAAVGLLLVLACGNVANLLLTRAKDRERELAVRAALGAGRPRLVTQNLMETLILGSFGGLLGLALARWGSSYLVGNLPENLPRQSEIGVDGSVLLFTVGISIGASLLAMLVPTVRIVGREAVGGLKESGRGATSGIGKNRTNRAIVVGQVALATVLLFAAGLLFRSLQTLSRVDPGFRSEGVTIAQLMLPEMKYGEVGQVMSFYDQLRERVEALPGVSDVAFAMDHPLQTTWWNGIRLLDRAPPDPEESPIAIFRPVSDRYFETVGIPVSEGRSFDSGDRFSDHPVMLVNQALVQRYFNGESPLGERIGFTVGRNIWGEEAPTTFEIVGVIENVRFNGLRMPSEPAFHIPMHQFPYGAVKLLVRGSGTIGDIPGLIQDQVWAVDPDLPVTNIRTLDQVLAEVMAQDRFNVLLLQYFALVALTLAAAGIYGILNYVVSQRKPEIGVRVALGAQTSSVLGSVVVDALRLGGLGLGIGLVAGLGVSRFLEVLLFEVPPHDLLVISGVCSVLGLVTLGSGVVPALRAARTDPMDALRPE